MCFLQWLLRGATTASYALGPPHDQRVEDAGLTAPVAGAGATDNIMVSTVPPTAGSAGWWAPA